jgi:hypothetical protein
MLRRVGLLRTDVSEEHSAVVPSSQILVALLMELCVKKTSVITSTMRANKSAARVMGNK